MKIAEEKMVSVTYDLTVDADGKPELMERATKEHPLTFMFGMGMMLESFEKHLKDLAVGDKFKFTLKAEEAYGEHIPENVVELPKHIFEVEGKFDEERIKEGETLPMMDNQGHRMMGSVIEVKEDVVIMDFNHPLAGEDLTFEGEVIDVHTPTPEEIAALTNQGGCGCGCNECDSDCDCEGEESGKENGGCGCGC